MQLPVTGHPVHTRSLTVVVTQRDDGRWHARGDVIDLRKCSFVPMHGDLQPAGIVHQMSIEAVVDPATQRLESLVTDQPFVAIEPTESSGGECCRDPAPRLQALVGERIVAGFERRLSEVFGGPRGCSHLLTLFQLMGSALVRAFEREALLLADCGAERSAGERLFRRAVFLDGHEIDDARVGVGIQLADFHTRPAARVKSPLDRLAEQSDARAYAVVAREELTLRELSAAVRERCGDTLASATWSDATALVVPLLGASVMSGLAGRLFGLLGDVPERRLLLDCLLQLAPGYIQLMAALMERWFTQPSPFTPPASEGESPPFASVGGMPDSCYMWRAGGAMSANRGLSISPPDDDAD